MFWFDHDVSGWGWFVMSVGMIAFWAVIITAAVLLFRALGRATEPTRSPAAPSPEQLLAERFARGEIDEEEYRRRLDALRVSGPLPQHPPPTRGPHAAGNGRLGKKAP
ncbi:SHOCT domain-containing protein [Streptomyces finlayi]|uniref:SHOCT domain-containing protein n=2 Tax=Streptomyces finlayi TaxID=67296 RepID=A0A7G7BW33_9ACTN|nr:SHOCT domain-containing protein [Streptomyces finlayi]